MDPEIFLSEKKYISARRAAEITNYTPDYIGQLCRKGKVSTTLVGRTRYVCEEEILAYKNGHQIPGAVSLDQIKSNLLSTVVFVDSDHVSMEDNGLRFTPSILVQMGLDQSHQLNRVVEEVLCVQGAVRVEVVEGRMVTPVVGMNKVEEGVGVHRSLNINVLAM